MASDSTSVPAGRLRQPLELGSRGHAERRPRRRAPNASRPEAPTAHSSGSPRARPARRSGRADQPGGRSGRSRVGPLANACLLAMTPSEIDDGPEDEGHEPAPRAPGSRRWLPLRRFSMVVRVGGSVSQDSAALGSCQSASRSSLTVRSRPSITGAERVLVLDAHDALVADGPQHRGELAPEAHVVAVPERGEAPGTTSASGVAGASKPSRAAPPGRCRCPWRARGRASPAGRAPPQRPAGPCPATRGGSGSKLTPTFLAACARAGGACRAVEDAVAGMQLEGEPHAVLAGERGALDPVGDDLRLPLPLEQLGEVAGPARTRSSSGTHRRRESRGTRRRGRRAHAEPVGGGTVLRKTAPARSA